MDRDGAKDTLRDLAAAVRSGLIRTSCDDGTYPRELAETWQRDGVFGLRIACGGSVEFTVREDLVDGGDAQEVREVPGRARGDG